MKSGFQIKQLTSGSRVSAINQTNAIKEGYSELFGIYPQAHNASDNELESFFSTRTSSGRQVISYMVSTFKTLCELADFDSTQPHVSTVEAHSSSMAVAAPSSVAPLPPTSTSTTQLTPSLHIDIQIHISADASPDQIDQIFASMAKHLYKVTTPNNE